MKVAICNVQEFNPEIGGIERVSVSLAEGLISRGIEVLFVACRKSPYSKEYELPARQIFLPDSTDYSERNVEAFCKIVNEEKIDILLNQNSHSELYNKTCKETKLRTSVKLISVLHFAPNMRILSNRNLFNPQYFGPTRNLEFIARELSTKFPLQYFTMKQQRRLMRFLYDDSDKIVLLSEKYIELYKKVANIRQTDKLTAINNMLSFPYEKDNTCKKKQILFCGRLAYKQKRPDRLLKIWNMIQDQIPEWSLVILGDGPLRQKLVDNAEKLGLKRVTFAGFQDPIKYYKESSIFCMTSNHEGFPMVLTEAMQYGCVPVAFNSFDSLSEIIDNNKNGFIIEPFDLNDYGNKIISLIKSQNLKDFSDNAFKSMERLTIDKITDKWIELFEKL